MEPLSAAALLFCSTAQPGPYPSAPAVVDAFLEASNRKDIAGVRQFITKDAIIALGDERISGQEVTQRYEEIVFPRFPKARTEIRNRLAATDIVAQTEWVSLSGSGKGEIGLSVYRVVHGCIVSVTYNVTDESDAQAAK